MHQRIRFAAYNAFPTGEVYTWEVPMSKLHVYEITATPNGPRGTSCQIEDMFRAAVPPVAAFDATMDWMTVTVDASDSYDPEMQPLTYAWDFGDAVTGSDMVMTHTYLTPGDKTIVLTVTDTDGLADSTSQSVNPQMEPLPPVAIFSAVMDWMTVTVDAGDSYDQNTPPQTLTYAWDFGDLTFAGDLVTTTHTYATEGPYTIKLTVTNTVPLSAEATQPVNAVMPKPPVAGFSVSLTAHDTVLADATTLSNDPDGAIVEYAWNFGDGGLATSVDSTATHTYAKAGTYTITLVVTDNDGLPSSPATKDVILVDNGPTASFLITVTGLTVDVDAIGSDDDWGIASFTWNWNDGSALETYAWPTTTASHTYAVPGDAVSVAAAASVTTGRPEPPPYTIAGYTYDGDTTTRLADCSVIVTDVTKGLSSPVLISSASGFYSTNLYSWCPIYEVGDTIKVVATKGTLYGEATGIVAGSALALSVRLYGTGPQPFEVTITLTVMDTAFQTATLSQKVWLTPP
jgi:PKD repeat protein